MLSRGKEIVTKRFFPKKYIGTHTLLNMLQRYTSILYCQIDNERKKSEQKMV